MKLALDTKVTGHYRMELVSPETGEVTHDTGWFDNIITDVGLDAILRSCTSGYDYSDSYYYMNDFFRRVMYFLENDHLALDTSYSRRSECHVWLGQGTSPPSQTEHLGLEAPIVSTTNQYYGYWSGVSETNGYMFNRMRVEFAPNTIPGSVTEVGIGLDSGRLFSRALFPNGPLEIPADSILRIFYEVRFNLNLNDRIGNATLNYEGVPTEVTYTFRPVKLDGDTLDAGQLYSPALLRIDPELTDFVWANAIDGLSVTQRCRAYPNDIGSRIQLPMGPHTNGPVSANSNNWGNLSWDNLEFTSVFQFNYSNGANSFPEGIKAFVVHTPLSGTWQIGITPPLPKNANNQLTITVGTRLSRP